MLPNVIKASLFTLDCSHNIHLIPHDFSNYKVLIVKLAIVSLSAMTVECCLVNLFVPKPPNRFLELLVSQAWSFCWLLT